MRRSSFNRALQCSEEFREPGTAQVHLLPGILRQHLAAIGRKQSPEDIASILLKGLRLLPGSFSELTYKLELDELVIFLMLCCGLQGGYLLLLAGHCGFQGFNAILQGLDGLLDCLVDDLLELESCQNKDLLF